MNQLKQAMIIFKGNVQGIGFRYFAREIALKLGIKGHAMNLSNGDVELLLQGTEEKIKQMLSEIKKEFQNNIKSLIFLEEKNCRKPIQSFSIKFLNK